MAEEENWCDIGKHTAEELVRALDPYIDKAFIVGSVATSPCKANYRSDVDIVIVPKKETYKSLVVLMSMLKLRDLSYDADMEVSVAKRRCELPADPSINGYSVIPKCHMNNPMTVSIRLEEHYEPIEEPRMKIK